MRFSGRGIQTIHLGICAFAVASLFVLGASDANAAGVETVRVVKDDGGQRLQVDGRDFMVFGMNWDYSPIGTNYLYSLWVQPDEMIRAALAQEMPLLKAMGVNAIRQYNGVPPRWVQYIFETYGIYTMINHPMARYGYTLDGVWVPSVDYSDPKLRAAVKNEILALVDEFQDTPGMLMWLLGNENNYGLTWSSAEVEALPEGERDSARAKHLYSLYGDISAAIQARDTNRPVAIANGDLQYIDLIAQECSNIDILGSNVYRGISARDLYQVVHDKLGIPVMYTEFGADAWNAKENREDQQSQARYLIGQWKEIYEQSSGKGKVGNCIGGYIFQWADGWWKFGQDSNLAVHDVNASWPNAGYIEDYVEGNNNMNEEWWGICAKGPSDSYGMFSLYPRAAYYAMKQAFTLDPYAPQTDLAAISAHFANIEPMACVLLARGDHATLVADALERVRVSGMRLKFETYSTGGSNVSTPPAEQPAATVPSFRGFDHLQAFWADFQVKPSGNVTGNLSLSILGNVPLNPINEIFYENRGRQQTFVNDAGEPVDLQSLERVKVYSASVAWDEALFRLNGFYRTGHTHWGYEGDFFGLYQDAYYGNNVDIYNGDAPVGVELEGKKQFTGFKLAFGPQLWWGANPAILLKYSRNLAGVDVTGMFQKDFAQQSSISSSVAIPLPATRKATLHLKTQRGALGIELGGIVSGTTKEGEEFQIADPTPDGSYRILIDSVRSSDALGAKGKLTYQKGRWNWYAQAAYLGIVADGGYNPTITYTRWKLRESNSGNQSNFITGIAVNMGNFQISPNFLYQKPLVGPIPFDAPAPAIPRNVLDDPFAVRSNRETVGGELLITHDPTPATWMWAWDNDIVEDAPLAWSLGFDYRHQPTTLDAAIGILADGRTTFPFPGGTPPRDLWELRLRTVSKVSAYTRLIVNAFAGTAEPNGNDPRLIERYGFSARFTRQSMAFETAINVNDWGPYDYHRDGNLTFPLQVMADLSHTLGSPKWFSLPQTRFGVRTTWRSLDRYSPRYCPEVVPDPSGNLQCDPTAPGDKGKEWEIRTYLEVVI